MVSNRLERFAYPITGEARERPLLACWVLVLLGFLVPFVPLIPLFGYLVRVLVRSADGDTECPPFLTDGFELIRLGVGATVVLVCYLVVPLVLLLVTINGVLESSRALEGFTRTVIALSGSTVVLLLSLLAAYVLPLALTHYGRERRLRAAFDRSAISSLARRLNVFVGWVTALVVLTVGGAIGNALVTVSRVGPVLAALALAYTVVLASHHVGYAIARAER